MRTYPGIDVAGQYVKTGEFRAPLAGEFYISGAIPEVYRAPNDLSVAYHLARPVEELKFHRVNSDIAGNPRYVVDYSNLRTLAELKQSAETWVPFSTQYAQACKRANSIGGAKYRGKAYRGGIVFQSYSVDETAIHISRVTGRLFVAVKG